MGMLFVFGFLALIFLTAICVVPFWDDWAQIPISWSVSYCGSFI